MSKFALGPLVLVRDQCTTLIAMVRCALSRSMGVSIYMSISLHQLVSTLSVPFHPVSTATLASGIRTTKTGTRTIAMLLPFNSVSPSSVSVIPSAVTSLICQ